MILIWGNKTHLSISTDHDHVPTLGPRVHQVTEYRIPVSDNTIKMLMDMVYTFLPFLTLIRVPSWWSHRSLARLCDRGDLWQVPFWIWNTSYVVNYRCRSENWALEQRMQWSYHMILTVYTMINKQYINNLPTHNNPYSRKTQVNHCVNIRKCNHQSKF